MKSANGSRSIKRQDVAQRLYLNIFSITFSIAIIICGLISTQATAASFDCKKASTWLEKTVCANPELSKLDEQMAKAYQDALKSLSPEGQKETKQYQKQWLKMISSSSNSEDGLKNQYKERIKQLQHILIKFPDHVFRNVYVDDSKTDKTCETDASVDKELTYPQIEYPRNENEKFWNSLISQKAIDGYKGYKNEECTNIFYSCTIIFNNKRLISGYCRDYSYDHGALHAIATAGCLNWLLETRQELQIADLFDNKTDWRNKLSLSISQKKKEQEAHDGTKLTAPGEDVNTGLMDISNINSKEWMISKEGLSFRLTAWNYFAFITIDWKILEPYLSKKGRLLIFD